MHRSIGRWILGLVAGWFLSRMRMQAGGDVLTWPLFDVQSAANERAAALLILGLALWNVRFGLGLTTLLSIPIGYALHALCFGLPASPSFLGFVFLALIALVGAVLAVRAREPKNDTDGSHPVKLGEKLGLIAAGAGLAIALESVARHVRLFGGGLSQDDGVFGATFIVLVSFGAIAFGWITRKKSLRRLAFPVLLAASAAACFLSLSLVDTLATPRGLDTVVRRFGLDVSYHGTLGWDALIAGRVFVLPALLLGAAIGAARGAGSLGSTLLGAALGIVVFPRLLSREGGHTADEVALFSAQFVPLATVVTVAGAALATIAESKRKPRARYVAMFLAALCALPAILVTIKPIYVLSPWEPRPIFPYVVFESAQGLVTVEPSAGGLKVATLDRRLISPNTLGSVSDALRIRRSIELLSPAQLRKPSFKVLFVGQLTALRAHELVVAGASVIDRSATWHAAMANLEGELFKAQEGQAGLTLPPGEILAPRDARERLERGDYDLVIAPPIAGDMPMLEDVDVPETTVVVRWFLTDEPLRAGEIPASTYTIGGTKTEKRVLLPCGNGFDELSFALVTNGTLPPENDPSTPALLLPIEPRSNAPRPIQHLLTRKYLRYDASRLAMAERLARAASGEKAIALTSAMRTYYAAQLPSSPFETAEQKVELEDATLEDLVKAALAGPLDPFTRQTWEWLAWVLVGKRDVTRIDRFVAPVATKHAPWTGLEIALAHADIEGLEPKRAIERLTPIVAREPSNFRVLVALGDAHDAAGDAPAAIAMWRRANETAPRERSVRRKLAIALIRAGDPEGASRARELLVEDPHDDQIKTLLETARRTRRADARVA